MEPDQRDQVKAGYRMVVLVRATATRQGTGGGNAPVGFGVLIVPGNLLMMAFEAAGMMMVVRPVPRAMGQPTHAANRRQRQQQCCQQKTG